MYAHIYKVFMRIHVRLCGCAVDLASSPGDSRVGSAYVCGDHVCGDHEGKHTTCGDHEGRDLVRVLEVAMCALVSEIYDLCIKVCDRCMLKSFVRFYWNRACDLSRHLDGHRPVHAQGYNEGSWRDARMQMQMRVSRYGYD